MFNFTSNESQFQVCNQKCQSAKNSSMSCHRSKLNADPPQPCKRGLYCSPNPRYFRIWSCLQIGSLQMYLVDEVLLLQDGSLIHYDWCPSNKMVIRRQRPREKAVGWQGWRLELCCASRGTQTTTSKLPEARKRRDHPSAVFGGKAVLPTPRFGTLAFRIVTQ